MRIVVMGTGPFAVPSAERLWQEGHAIPLVVTRPLSTPLPKKLPPRPVFDWATAHELPIFEPASINDEAAIAYLREQHADLFFVCDYGQILSHDCLTATKLGGLNLHGSILPRHRGAAPVQWALLRGDHRTGVTVIHMTPRLDAGPALAIASTEIAADETAQGLEPRLAEIGVAATVAAVGKLADWDGQAILGEAQDQSLVTRAPRFHKSHGQLDCRHSAEYLGRLVRACQPWPGTYGELQWEDGKRLRVIVRLARVSDGNLVAGPVGAAASLTSQQCGGEGDHWRQPWQTVLALKCQTGTLLIARLQPAGKREMDASEFLRGHPIDGNAKFVLPDPPVQSLV